MSSQKKMHCNLCKDSVLISETRSSDGRFNGYTCENGHEGLEVSNHDLHEHSKACDGCGKVSRVYSQEDYGPEYYTDIHVECECGELVKIVVPVN